MRFFKFFDNREMHPTQEGTAFCTTIHHTSRGCCKCFSVMKVIKCLCTFFYIFVCLFGNIITAIFLYKQYYKTQIPGNHVIANVITTSTSTPAQNSDEGAVNATNAIDDWFIDFDIEEEVEPSPNNETKNVS